MMRPFPMRTPGSTSLIIVLGMIPRTARIPWACPQCVRQRPPRSIPQQQQRARYSTQSPSKFSGSGSGGNNSRARPQKAVKYAAAAVGTVGAGALVFSNDIKHAYAAVERSGRVVSTLAVCINE
jgi:aarF domain-containing kinase